MKFLKLCLFVVGFFFCSVCFDGIVFWNVIRASVLKTFHILLRGKKEQKKRKEKPSKCYIPIGSEEESAGSFTRTDSIQFFI
jgi:hypothetical protein